MIQLKSKARFLASLVRAVRYRKAREICFGEGKESKRKERGGSVCVIGLLDRVAKRQGVL